MHSLSAPKYLLEVFKMYKIQWDRLFYTTVWLGRTYSLVYTRPLLSGQLRAHFSK